MRVYKLVRDTLAFVAVGIAILLSWPSAEVAGQSGPLGPEPISPVTPIESANSAKLSLGEALFHDPRLSHGDVFACVSCHIISAAGDDGRDRAIGGDSRPLDFNTPTIFNAAVNFRFNWRGNFHTLQAQNEATL